MNFKNLYSEIKIENPFAMFFAGDFNGNYQLWWPESEETPEGREIEYMLTSANTLDPLCHHQIIYCKANIRIPPPLLFKRKFWHSNRANTGAIKRSMTKFPWLQHLLNNDPNWQVKTFTDILLYIMSNFFPSETKRFVPRDPPWITRPLKHA